MIRQRLGPALAVALVVAGCTRPADPPRRSGLDITLVPDTRVVRDRVPDKVTLAGLLAELELRQDLIPAVITTTQRVFDPRRLHAGNTFSLVRTLDGLLRTFEYEIDLDTFLRVVAKSDAEPTVLTAEIVPYEKERAPATIRGEISRDAASLFAAMDDTGETAELTMGLAEIFAGEIDFNSDLQPGDTFTVAFEKVFREGQFAAYGPIAAAEFRNDGRTLRAIRFTPPGGKPGYYDEQGRSLKRFFLRSPLRFEPVVTSRFSRSRFHPVLRIYRPHLGVDYRAATGAPVIAVASGVVLAAGFSGQGGRTVHLRHPSGYETYYMHLSSIAVRAGAHVAQGDLIGRVGSSGLATGPHLDYRIKRNGQFVNPLNEHKRLPPGEPIAPGLKAQFAQERDAALARLDGPPSTAPAASPAGPATVPAQREPGEARPVDTPAGKR
jgi:murein DD-endopeptidase MepM/ murein hydrolase activator NlpD